MESLDTLVESSDLAGLSRFVDLAANTGEWETLVDVVERCGEAVRRGKQVWAVAQYAEYRLALDAPPAYAGGVVGDGRAGFALGPLWEVAASRHSWRDLAPHLGAPASRALAAHERLLRGDDVSNADIDPTVLALPLDVGSWEPTYPLAVYRGDGADFPHPGMPEMTWIDLPQAPAGASAEDPVCDALLELVRPWWEESSGRAVTVTVAGSGLEAIRALGPRRVRAARTDLGSALAAMAWAGASGGAFGRRRGAPIGRLGAWWVLAEVLGYDEPPQNTSWGEEGEELTWWLWDPGEQIGGWGLHLAVHDESVGTSWALSSVDMR